MPVDRLTSTNRLARLFGPTALVASLVVLLHTMSVNASRPAVVKADPTPVAVVNVARVLEQIDEKSEWEIKIEALKGSIQQEGIGRQQAMERRLAESEAASSPEEKGPLYEPANDKVYRHPTFFDIPDEVGAM